MFTSGSRRGCNSFLANKTSQLSRRATQAHQAYLKSLKHPTEVFDVDPALVPPTVRNESMLRGNPNGRKVPELRQLKRWAKNEDEERFWNDVPSLLIDSSEETWQQALHQHAAAGTLKDHIPLSMMNRQRKFKGLIRRECFGKHLGSIEVHHGLPLKYAADIIVVSLPQTLPSSGPALELFEAGGDDFLLAMEARIQRRLVRNNQVAKEASADDENDSKLQKALSRTDETRKLDIGGIIAVSTPNAVCAAQEIAFAIMPLYYCDTHGTVVFAYREALRKAFENIWRGDPRLWPKIADRMWDPPKSLIVSFLGRNEMRGFQRRPAAATIMEELVEALLQLDKIQPYYSIQDVKVVSEYISDAQILGDALAAVAASWLPEKRITTASARLYRRSRRLIRIPHSHFRNLFSRAKYYHNQCATRPGCAMASVPGHLSPHWKKGHYRGNRLPFFWRKPIPPASRLMVNSLSGKAVKTAIPKSQYMSGENSFPQAYGFKRLRVQRGHWTGLADQPRIDQRQTGFER